MIYMEAVMVVIFVLLVLIVVIAGLLIFSHQSIKNQKEKEERKITNYHGHTVVNFSYPKPTSKQSLEEFENDMLHLWAEGYFSQCKTQDEVLKYVSEIYNKTFKAANSTTEPPYSYDDPRAKNVVYISFHEDNNSEKLMQAAKTHLYSEQLDDLGCHFWD